MSDSHKKTAGKKPSISSIFRLRCPYCMSSALQKKGSWFYFSDGCQDCDYPYMREAGYFTGASWMVTFPVCALLSLGLAAFLKVCVLPDTNTLLVLALVSLFILIFGAFFTPFAMAIWLYVDHLLHPLNNDDCYKKDLIN